MVKETAGTNIGNLSEVMKTYIKQFVLCHPLKLPEKVFIWGVLIRLNKLLYSLIYCNTWTINPWVYIFQRTLFQQTCVKIQMVDRKKNVRSACLKISNDRVLYFTNFDYAAQTHLVIKIIQANIWEKKLIFEGGGAETAYFRGLYGL